MASRARTEFYARGLHGNEGEVTEWNPAIFVLRILGPDGHQEAHGLGTDLLCEFDGASSCPAGGHIPVDEDNSGAASN